MRSRKYENMSQITVNMNQHADQNVFVLLDYLIVQFVGNI